jgi:mRNA interferase HigB
MRVISRKRLRKAQPDHPELFDPLNAWWKVAANVEWKNIDDVRKIYRATDPVGRFTVFNIKGNKYRLIVRMEYRKHLIFIIAILTHAQYDKGAWKNK